MTNRAKTLRVKTRVAFIRPELRVGLAVKRPAGPIGAGQQFVGLRRVGDTARGAVVLDLLAHAVSHQPEQHHLDHVPGVLEITRGLQVALAGIDPSDLTRPAAPSYLIFLPTR